MTSRIGPPRRWPMVTAWLIVALVALVAGGFWLVQWRGACADAALEASWRQTLGGRSFLERYPTTEDNRTVLELEALGCDLGLEMAPENLPGRCHPSPEAVGRFQAIKPALKGLFDPAAVAEDGSLAAPPAGLATYLAESRPTLDRVTTLLLTSTAPVWKLNLDAGFELTIPNYLGILNLERLLAAQARDRVRAGRIDAALETLEAAWRYNQAVLELPNPLGQLIGQTVLKSQLTVLRGMPRAPETWQARLYDLDLRHRMLIALQADAFLAYRSSTFDRAPSDLEDLRPWWLLRWTIRDYSRRFQSMIDELPKRDLRSFDPDDFERQMLGRIPRWQFVSRLLLTNWEVWPRSTHLELAAELTALGLVERERLAVGAPPHGSGQRPSRVEGLPWIYEDLPEGTRMRLGGRFQHPGPQPFPLIFFVRNTAADTTPQKSVPPIGAAG